MAKKFPIHSQHPEHICRGSGRYCRVDSILCGNGGVATPHRSERFGNDGVSWGRDAREPGRPVPPATPEAFK